MSYVYIESENWKDDEGIRRHLYTVGFYKPDGSFETHSDHSDRGEAADVAAWLNGGAPLTVIEAVREAVGLLNDTAPQENTIGYHHVDCFDDVWRWCIVRNFDGQCGDVVCVLQDEHGEPLPDLAERIIMAGVLR